MLFKTQITDKTQTERNKHESKHAIQDTADPEHEDRNGRHEKAHAASFANGDGDFAATDTLVEISDDTFFGEIRGKCTEAGSILDTAAGVTAKLTFADGTVVTHTATIAE